MIVITGIALFATAMPKQTAAQLPVAEIIKAAVVKVIKAVDLKIQRLQNQTIWLQNAQKTLENELSKLKLREISDWANHQKELYAKYFDELYAVKSVLSDYKKVRDIINNQRLIVKEYSKAIQLTRQDRNFTGAEIEMMENVYSGILGESLKNLEQLSVIIRDFNTQMSDGKRLVIIHDVAENIETNLSDLRQFNKQNILVSLQRSKEKNEVDVVKRLYSLE